MKYTDKQISLLLQAIFEGRINPSTNLPESLYLSIGRHLIDGMLEGYESVTVDFGGKDLDLIKNLNENVYMFSAAKTYQQCRDMANIVAESPSFSIFKAKALEIYDKYNVDWLKAEYVTAIGQATQAAQWVQIEDEKDLFPYLRYNAVMDSNTSDICRSLEGVTLPVDHPTWSKYSPLNHFRCRCVFERIDRFEKVKTTSTSEVKRITKELDEKVSDVFKMNPGKDGYIFSPKHPYFDVAKNDKPFAKRNFDLPIPKIPKK